MPGLQRAQRRLRPRQRADHARVLDGDEWVINGQKVWTSLAHVGHWCFVLAAPSRRPQRHGAVVPARADGPARHRDPPDRADHRRRRVQRGVLRRRPHGGRHRRRRGGRRLAGRDGTLGFERGVSTLGQQVGFEHELDAIIDARPPTAACDADPVVRQRLAARGHRAAPHALERAALDVAPAACPGPEASISKLFWATWHRDLGELAVDVLGADGDDRRGRRRTTLTLEQKLFLFSPRRHDLRRLERDPAQRHRRACARPAEGAADDRDASHPYRARATACSTGKTRARHRGRRHRHRLRDRATLRRGGRDASSISDIHERRLRESRRRARRAPASRATSPTRRACRRCSPTRADDARRASTCSSTTPGSAAPRELVDMTDEQWSTVLDVTLTGTFRCTRAALRAHVRRRAAA